MENNPEKTGRTSGRMKKVTLTKSFLTRKEVTAPSGETPVAQTGKSGHLLPRGFFATGSIRYTDVTVFLRQLIMLLESGTSILRSLKSLALRSERASVKGLINDIALYVEGGNALWQAFDRHPRYFDTVFVNLIRASEASGTLTVVLRRLVAYRESREILRKRVRGAMIYPVLLVIACIVALIVITSFVVPVFADFFTRSNLQIPHSTRLLIQVSALIRTFWWVPVVLIIALIAVYELWFVRNPVRRLAADYVKLKVPILGPIIHKNAITEMCRTMSLLLRSGLSMMSTLDLTRAAIHNRAVAESLKGMRDSVENGGGLEDPMRAAKVIPPVVVDMFVTGEESGRVDQIAEQIADIYEEEVRIAISGLGDALQPIFTLVVGAVVLVLFISLFLPIITMIDTLGKASAL